MATDPNQQVLQDKDQIKQQLGPRDRTEGDLVFRRVSELLQLR